MISNNFWNINKSQSNEISSNKAFYTIDKNLWPIFPENIVKEITDDYIENGTNILAINYFMENYNGTDTCSILQNIYVKACINKDEMIARNIILILSYLPFEYLGYNCITILTSALANKNLEIKEFGIQCVENWNNKQISKYLENIDCGEQWLNTYAKKIQTYIAKEGKENVLFEENSSWQMAENRNVQQRNTRYDTSRCNNIRS